MTKMACGAVPALVFALALVSTGSAADTVVRAAGLVSHCDGAKGADDYCKGHLDGYVDAGLLYDLTIRLQFTNINLPGNLPPFCVSPSVTVDSIAKEFVAYMNAHTDKSSDAAGTAVLEMLAEKYPCSQ
jgi:hypothetical protein